MISPLALSACNRHSPPPSVIAITIIHNNINTLLYMTICFICPPIPYYLSLSPSLSASHNYNILFLLIITSVIIITIESCFSLSDWLTDKLDKTHPNKFQHTTINTQGGGDGTHRPKRETIAQQQGGCHRISSTSHRWMGLFAQRLISVAQHRWTRRKVFFVGAALFLVP